MQIYKAVKYLRRSYVDSTPKEKDKQKSREQESETIGNQRKLIDNFLEQHPDIEAVDEKIDDGYSGVLFDRPAFQEMMRDIAEGKVNCVIVKDA